MEISINGKKADIILEGEKTAGDVLSGLELWLANSDPRYNNGFRLSGLVIDGEKAGADSISAFFDRDISSITSLDIIITSISELVAEALMDVCSSIDKFKDLDYNAKLGFGENWKTGPAAALLLEQSPELYRLITGTFSGEGAGAGDLTAIIEERLRELENPSKELKGMEQLVNEISLRLEDLSLDIQTGKDKKAVETVHYFSGIAEKVFRLYNSLKNSGFPVEEIRVTDIPVSVYMGEFNNTLKELLQAYEYNDLVLIGDIAEYELAPRLRSLYAALNSPFTAAA